MYWLSDITWGDFPTWMQAITALIALILSFITLLQNKKIKELVDIVIELKRQTDILEKRYELERRLSLKNLIPYFEYQNYGKGHFGVVVVTLVNVGKTAYNVGIDYLVNPSDKYEIRPSYSRNDYPTNEPLQYSIFYNRDVIHDKANFAFHVIFHDGSGASYSQAISCCDGKITIDSPMLHDKQKF